MEFRIEDRDTPPLDRFDDTRTTYMGRKIRLPVFWIEGERFSLTLTNMVRVVEDLNESQAILGRCLDLLEVRDRNGIEGAALALQEQCRKLTGWKAKYKRDVPKRPLRRHHL